MVYAKCILLNAYFTSFSQKINVWMYIMYLILFLRLFLKLKVKTLVIFLSFLMRILRFVFTGLYANIDQVNVPLYVKSVA